MQTHQRQALLSAYLFHVNALQISTNYGTITAPLGTPLNFGTIGVPTGPNLNKGTITNPTP